MARYNDITADLIDASKITAGKFDCRISEGSARYTDPAYERYFDYFTASSKLRLKER